MEILKLALAIKTKYFVSIITYEDSIDIYYNDDNYILVDKVKHGWRLEFSPDGNFIIVDNAHNIIEAVSDYLKRFGAIKLIVE